MSMFGEKMNRESMGDEIRKLGVRQREIAMLLAHEGGLPLKEYRGFLKASWELEAVLLKADRGHDVKRG